MSVEKVGSRITEISKDRYIKDDIYIQKFDYSDYENDPHYKYVLNNAPKNDVIIDSFVKASSIINSGRYKSILVSVSGGADSDIVVDMLTKISLLNNLNFVWFDTGLEYEATKQHIKYLEDKYNIKIHKEKAVKSIPLCCKEYGQPFCSKYVSQQMSKLISADFKWEDTSYEELIKKYPSCTSSLKWWCNNYGEGKSRYNINNNRYLKEFIIQRPPTFNISAECCNYAKKKVSNNLVHDNKCDLIITGIRKAEGGIRSIAYDSCFSYGEIRDKYRPIFWYKKSDREQYEKHYNITHSDCYTKYGYTRTGCACCPFGADCLQELENLEEYEPNLYKASKNIFKDAYEYTYEYNEYKKKMKARK